MLPMAVSQENNTNEDGSAAANDGLPDPAVVASLGLRSTELGQSLQAALHSLFQDKESSVASDGASSEEEEPGDELNGKEKKSAGIQISDDDHEIQESIQSAFGQAFADTMLGKTATSEQKDGDYGGEAPRILMRGRLDHYNRVATNWRIVADAIQVHERKPLPKKRKRTDRLSLWDVAGGDNEKQPPETIEGTLEILAYNDV